MEIQPFDNLSNDLVVEILSLVAANSMEGFFNEEVNAFIKRCTKCDCLVKVESGMKLLDRAAELGYLGASYIVGLLLVCEGGESKKNEGVGLLRKVYSTGRLVECREKYLISIRGINLRRYDCEIQVEHCKRRGWVRDIDYYGHTKCEQCICRAETQILYKYCKRP
ncbi:hypothetical protein ACJRO7_006644 [Eucalyptus globulus]|uniref:At2g35280-like TPR domain-containing protein n=1 Tax=Eucalyptus globulus TaxID=34317 RepID=A0ABD3INJ7_EUCGL